MPATTNTRAFGFAGLAVGAGSIIASVAAFFKLISTSSYLLAFAYAVAHMRHHIAHEQDYLAIAQLCGALVAIVGSLFVALLMAYLGKPATLEAESK
jgi:small-conductance mechanosensitive channel